MKKQLVRYKVKFTVKIKINGISLTLIADEVGNKIKISYKSGDSRLRYSETLVARSGCSEAKFLKKMMRRLRIFCSLENYFAASGK
jgi:hypothetical protein